MASQTRISVPLSELGHRSLRLYGGVLALTLIGSAIAALLPLPPVMTVFGALTLGMAIGSHRHVHSGFDTASRGVFAVGMACLGSAALFLHQPIAGWTLLGLALASSQGMSLPIRASRVASFAVRAALFAGAAYGLMEVLGRPDTLRQFSSVQTLGALAGGLATVGVLTSALRIERHAPLPQLVERQLPASAEVMADDADEAFLAEVLEEVEETAALLPDRAESADRALFASEVANLEDTRGRVERLLLALEEANPHVTDFATQIRGSISATMDQANESIERWRTVEKSDPAARRARLESRIDDVQLRLEGAEGGFQRQLQLALEQQEKTLKALDDLLSERNAFAVRLEQVHSGLELLELAVERALTTGSDIDSSEVEAIVDALAESCDLAPVRAGQRS